MTDKDANVTALFLAFSRLRLLERYWPRLRACVETLTEEQVWWRPNEQSNSVGNLVLHLNGNVRQWLVDSFEGREDKRDRPAEFATQNGMTAAALLERLSATLHDGAAVLARLTESDLLKRFEIQGYHVSGLEAVYQVVEHFGMHYGQIAYITKNLTGRDLGFYRDLAKTGRTDDSARLP
ncbi:MAG: DUF1572 family protein [Terracidiphilus sp.]|jgi:uncharacterized damage-inducible protein DinB